MITSAIQGWVVSALMAVGLVLMAVGWHGTYQTLEKERAQHEQVVQQFKDAQLEASRKAEAKRVELEQKAKKDAAEADKRYVICLLSTGLISCATKPIKVVAQDPVVVKMKPPQVLLDPVKVPGFLQ